MLTDDTVGAYLGGESADASAHMGDPTLMDMSADQTQPLDESMKIEDPASKTNNNDDVQPPVRHTPMVAAGGAPPGGADPVSYC